MPTVKARTDGDRHGSSAHLTHHRAARVVGPMSNDAPPPQLVENVPYHNMAEMHAFAPAWRNEHRGKRFTVPKLSGFCLLMNRSVYEKIGGLNERFGLGFFDDDDLAARARRASFELAVAQDLFVHHFGSRTFVGNGTDAETLLEENGRRFAEKWGPAEARGRRVALRPFAAKSQTHGERAHAAPSGPQNRLFARRKTSTLGRRPTAPQLGEARHRTLATAESNRWDRDLLAGQYQQFFETVAPRSM
jgi:hypothetical protein